jgi:hypothetical protein
MSGAGEHVTVAAPHVQALHEAGWAVSPVHPPATRMGYSFGQEGVVSGFPS